MIDVSCQQSNGGKQAQEGRSRLPRDGSALPRTRAARERDLGGKPRNKQTRRPHTHSPKHSARPTPHGGPRRPAATRRRPRSPPGCVRRRSATARGDAAPTCHGRCSPAGGGAGAGRAPPQPGTAVTRGPTPGTEPADVSAALCPGWPGDDGGAAHSIRRRQPRRKRRGVPAPGSAAPGRGATTRTLPVLTHRHHLRSLLRAGPAELCRASPAAAAAAAAAAASHRGGRRARPGGCDRCLPRASLRAAGGRKRRRRRRRPGSQPPSSSSGARPPLPPPSPGASCSALLGSAPPAPPRHGLTPATASLPGRGRAGRRSGAARDRGAGPGMRDRHRHPRPPPVPAGTLSLPQRRAEREPRHAGSPPPGLLLLLLPALCRPAPGPGPGGRRLLWAGCPRPIAPGPGRWKKGPRPRALSAPGMRGMRGGSARPGPAAGR
ncbi:uncharacterized protein LOC141729241 [Zonotrichia albicollis]|uniref:uncharacterized protein LOC141729241 n=1 Tax=Zonotrichia albicollis TaxID=44394 RepID=UPI003D80F299